LESEKVLPPIITWFLVSIAFLLTKSFLCG
jgi:hypothetical protein